MMKIGIWIDKDKALIVKLEDKKTRLNSVQSNIEHFHIHGGSGTRLKGGPQDVVQDSTYLEREKIQLKSFFKNITSEIKNADELVIFGPAETNEKFSKYLQENHNLLNTKIKGVKKADSMTDNQIVAWVKNFFNSK